LLSREAKPASVDETKSAIDWSGIPLDRGAVLLWIPLSCAAVQGAVNRSLVRVSTG
jgi:hypothetical protein